LIFLIHKKLKAGGHLVHIRPEMDWAYSYNHGHTQKPSTVKDDPIYLMSTGDLRLSEIV